MHSEENGTGYWITRLKYRNKYSLIKVQQQGFDLSFLIGSGLKRDQREGNRGVRVLLSNGGDWEKLRDFISTGNSDERWIMDHSGLPNPVMCSGLHLLEHT